VTAAPTSEAPVRLGLHFALASAAGAGWPALYAGCLEQCELAEAHGFATLDNHRFEEYLGLLKRLLAEENVRHEGRYASVSGLTVTPRPVQRPRPPIWIAAGVEPSARRAAREGDAWINRPVETLTQLTALDAVYREELATHGRAWSERERVLRRDVWVAEDDATAWAEAAPSVRAIRHFGPDRDVLPAGAPMDAVQAHARDRWIIGSPETVAREIERYRATLGTTVLLAALQHPGIDQGRVLNAIRLLGEVVAPRLARRAREQAR
jgi:alkanesulfonate monooxygenase SsuD/methylene tetrahydromethanopterin reductase-like flavin-dependent oxidoreductase (luciferase family)